MEQLQKKIESSGSVLEEVEVEVEIVPLGVTGGVRTTESRAVGEVVAVVVGFTIGEDIDEDISKDGGDVAD